MDVSKVPGKCVASFIVAVNWIYFVLHVAIVGVLLGLLAGYYGATNIILETMLGDKVQTNFTNSDTNLTEAQTLVIFTVGAVLSGYLLIQAFLNILLTRGVREGNIRKLTAWILISTFLLIATTANMAYKIFTAQKFTEDVSGDLIGIIWYLGSIHAIRIYRDNLAIAMILGDKKALDNPGSEKNPVIKV